MTATTSTQCYDETQLQPAQISFECDKARTEVRRRARVVERPSFINYPVALLHPVEIAHGLFPFSCDRMIMSPLAGYDNPSDDAVNREPAA